MRLLVSACLLGCACRYDGGCKPCEAVLALQGAHDLIPVCPEQMGGLPTPRPPAERQGDRVVNRLGQDVTEEYLRGAQEALRAFCGQIYDGSFSSALIPGDGVTAALLKENGIPVRTEEDLPAEETGLL